MIELLLKDSNKMSPADWATTLDSLPLLKAKIEADYDSDRVRFNSFRSCGQALSKLLGNLDRLRWKAAAGEDVSADIDSRQKQVKKMRANGIVPSAGVCVFNQMDVDKSRTVSIVELKLLFKGLKAVYPVSESEVESMMKTLDSDGSGEIDEAEW